MFTTGEESYFEWKLELKYTVDAIPTTVSFSVKFKYMI